MDPRSSKALDLPSEVWVYIFDLAADEDVIFQYGLPSAMAESAWVKNAFGKWTLRRPAEALNSVQRMSYTTKKAIISTCKTWHQIGSELMFRCLFFNEPKKLLSLDRVLNSSSSTATTLSSSLAWWTRRIHLCRYQRNISIEKEVEGALVSVIKRCPNLEIFYVEVPMGNVFGLSADTLATYAFKALRTVYWTVSCEEMPKVIWALASLKSIICAHIDFDSNSEEETGFIPLGAAGNITLTLPHLQQLSLQGFFGQFLEQATDWNLPSLVSLAFDCGSRRTDQPDAVGFLSEHGLKLQFLDLNCIPALEVAKILDLCPNLTTFCFNADWRVQPPGEEIHAPMSSQGMSVLVNRPHPNIHTIGLHGLMYAFGVGYAAEYASLDPLRGHVIQRSNDLNIAALNRYNFPKLQRVRALSKTMLTELNDEDGPSEEAGGIERYDNWWKLIVETYGIRLEDCTGALLGNLPEDDESTEDTETDSDEYEDAPEEWYSDESDEEEPQDRRRVSNVDELRELLAECRAMAAEREEPVFNPFMPMDGMGGMGMGMPMGMGMSMSRRTSAKSQR